MSVSGLEYDLPQMKEYFEKQLSKVRLISDLKLKEEDFKKLGVMLKSAFSFEENKNNIEEIIICYLVYWVYALLYWDEDTGIHDELTDYCMKLPQHMLRYHFQMLRDAFVDYQINEFGYQADSVEELCSMVLARHAGIPEDEIYQVFDLIDDYRNQNISVDSMVADIYAHLPYKTRYIFSLLDQPTRREMIWEIRNIMTEVSLSTCTMNAMLDKYSDTSINLIDSCFCWKAERRQIRNVQ